MPANGDGDHAALVAGAQSHDDADCCADVAQLEAVVAVIHGGSRNAHVRGHVNTQRMQGLGNA